MIVKITPMDDDIARSRDDKLNNTWHVAYYGHTIFGGAAVMMRHHVDQAISLSKKLKSTVQFTYNNFNVTVTPKTDQLEVNSIVGRYKAELYQREMNRRYEAGEKSGVKKANLEAIEILQGILAKAELGEASVSLCAMIAALDAAIVSLRPQQ